MKKIWLYLLVIGLLASCGNNEENPSDEGGEQVSSLNPEEMPKSLQKNFKEIVTAFQGDDTEKLEKFVSPDGFYVIYPANYGAYPEYTKYGSMADLQNDDAVAEYLGFMTQTMKSGNGLSGKIKFEDLSEADPCEYGELGYWADASAGITAVTNAYTALQENIGEEGDPSEYAAVQEVENAIDYKVLVGTGDEADVIYFNEEGGKWYLSVIDLSECGS